MTEIVTSVFAFVFGSMIGSFLNVLIWRLPAEVSVVFPRSKCPHCGSQLAWYHNIPILSFCLLKGHCSFCKERISWQYPLVELTIGAAFLIGIPWSFTAEAILLYLFRNFLFGLFLVHAIIDLRHRLLPDSINIVIAVLFVVYGYFYLNPLNMLLGAGIGIAFPLLVTYLFYKLRGVVGLGGGDIKLYGVLGIYLGAMGVVQNIFFSCFVGAIFGGVLIAIKKLDRKNPIPFGPFIILVASVQIFLPDLYRSISSVLF